MGPDNHSKILKVALVFCTFDDMVRHNVCLVMSGYCSLYNVIIMIQCCMFAFSMGFDVFLFMLLFICMFVCIVCVVATSARNICFDMTQFVYWYNSWIRFELYYHCSAISSGGNSVTSLPPALCFWIIYCAVGGGAKHSPD